jgi:hypothetical protein
LSKVPRDLGQRGQILGHLLFRAGPLDLDRDHPSIAQRGGVDLAERRRRHRLGFEHPERLRDLHAQLGFDDAFDVGEGKRLHVVLQA